MRAASKNNVVKINRKLIRKVKEITPELRTKTKRLAFVKAKVNAPITKEERKAEAKAIDRRVKHDVWNWNTRLDRAAFYIAENKLSMTEIAEETKINKNKLKRYMTLNGEFVARVAQYQEQWMAQFKAVGFGNKNMRINVLDDILGKMIDITKQRAKKYCNRKQPGVNTGLMTRTVKAVGHGNKTRIIRGWEFDNALVAEIKSTQVQIAKELGQWSEKVENSNTVLVREYDGVGKDDV